ncbi:hypothetical protein NM688_g6344 [Phlebia brevispora]|uniref:Uncharacterized protein n=1 Tax=Phlebia brevispora TaxID=194682 RepID=A0ACC1SH39_9APHY|nr:hypothetical protein NM688_g6344 [Phlebia brevispora]
MCRAHVKWNPACRWYRDCFDLSESPFQLTLHDFSCPPSSFSASVGAVHGKEPSVGDLFAIDGDISQTYPSLEHLNTAFKPISGGSGEIFWTQVPVPPLSDFMNIPRWRRIAMTLADIPIELYDLILGFLSLELCEGPGSPGYSDHRCKDRAACSRNYVSCTKRELHQILCVCRRWAHVLRPVAYERLVLRGRKDLNRLCAILDTPQQGVRGRYMEGQLDVLEHLRDPWIHNISIHLLPKLGLGAKDTSLQLMNTGPFPPKQNISTIHSSLPRHLPCFSSGIQDLIFSDVHFKTFEHLLRLVKELPSLRSVKCTRVTWGALSLQPDRMPSPTCFLAKEDPSRAVTYFMEGCTDDGAVHWLQLLLGQTRQDILNQNDVDALFATLSACTDFDGKSRRTEDEIGECTAVWMACDPEFLASTVIGRMSVYLSSRAGARQRRRVERIIFELQGKHSGWSDYDWPEIDRQLRALSAVQTIGLICPSRDLLLRYLNIILPFMSHLSLSPRLQTMYLSPNGLIQLLLTEDGIQEVAADSVNDILWKQILQKYAISMYPSLSSRSSITRELVLSDVHFKSFRRILGLIKEMPTLEEVKCLRITWDAEYTDTDCMPPRTAYSSRICLSHRLKFLMVDCTDDGAAHRLAILLGLTREDGLDPIDASMLCDSIALAWPQTVRTSNGKASCYHRGEITFGDGLSYDKLGSDPHLPALYVRLTPRDPIRQYRKVQCIAFRVSWVSVLVSHASKIVKLADLTALQIILLIFSSHHDLLEYVDNLRPLNFRPGRHSKLKLGFDRGDRLIREFCQVHLTDNGTIQEIGKSIKGNYGWEQLLTECAQPDIAGTPLTVL